MWEENSYFIHRKHKKKVADNVTCLKALSSSAHTLPFKYSASFLQGNVITVSNPFHQHPQWKPAFSTTTRSTGDVTLTNISIFQNSLCERPSKQLPWLAPGRQNDLLPIIWLFTPDGREVVALWLSKTQWICLGQLFCDGFCLNTTRLPRYQITSSQKGEWGILNKRF